MGPARLHRFRRGWRRPTMNGALLSSRAFHQGKMSHHDGNTDQKEYVTHLQTLVAKVVENEATIRSENPISQEIGTAEIQGQERDQARRAASGE